MSWIGANPQLYTYWRSSSAWRVRIALHLKGIPHTLKPVNIGPGRSEQLLPDFKQVNPQAQVPVLEWESERGTVRLAQSMAILSYLDKVAPEPRLFPEDAQLLAFALEAAELINAGIQPLQNIGVLDTVEKLGGKRQAFAASVIEKGLRSLEQLAQARGQGFSVGSTLTVADVLLIPQLYNARRFHVNLTAFPTLLAIEARCNALPAFQQAHPLQQPDAVPEPAAANTTASGASEKPLVVGNTIQDTRPQSPVAGEVFGEHRSGAYVEYESTGAEPKRSPRPGSAGVLAKQNGGHLEPQITKLLGVHYYVRNLERSRRFYVEGMDFAELGGSSAELEQLGRQRSLIFQAGEVTVVCSTPLGEGGRAYRYLRKHPDGIGTVIFEVQNIDAFFTRLERAGATPISDVETHRDEGGTLATFSITTPFGDTTFRFVERKGYRGFFPGMPLYAEARGGTNRFGIEQIDHITSNFQTMGPALMWLEHVLGFERFWEIEFHTKDVAVTKLADGSGLRSAVMRHPSTGIKFANNEPYRPFFKRSQINVFNEDHRGDGIQHLALSSPDIIATVRGLRAQGVRFMTTPDSYYEALPERLRQLGVGHVAEDLKTLNELGILVDGAGPGQYLLQIFLLDSAGLHQSAEAGPFFFEIIQRKGDRGFGAGNFRALFESIERDQQAAVENKC